MNKSQWESFDVIVVGAGHAGTSGLCYNSSGVALYS